MPALIRTATKKRLGTLPVIVPLAMLKVGVLTPGNGTPADAASSTSTVVPTVYVFTVEHPPGGAPALSDTSLNWVPDQVAVRNGNVWPARGGAATLHISKVPVAGGVAPAVAAVPASTERPKRAAASARSSLRYRM